MKDYVFGDFIKEKRIQHGLSQYQLGSLLGVSNKAVSKWERGLAKPKSQLLYKLSTILGVTIDELLIGNDYSYDEKVRILLEEQRNNLWGEAYRRLKKIYGERPPMEIISRFENEKLVLVNSDTIHFFDVISMIVKKAEENKMPVFVRGSIGASFIAYLFGASDVNPMPAHYYCPKCKTVEFISHVTDGWMLEQKECRYCNSQLIRDGHHMPFEIFRHTLGKNTGYDLIISKKFYTVAKDIILKSFSDYAISILEIQPKFITKPNASQIRTFVFCPASAQHEKGEYIVKYSHSEYRSRLCGTSYISLIFDDEYEKCIALENRVSILRSNVDILEKDVLRLILDGDVDGVPDFGLYQVKQLLVKYKPKNIGEVLKIYGIGLLTSTLSESEADLLISRITDLSEMIVYRDDVFDYVYSKLKEHGYYDFGFAYAVMDKTRKGIYRQRGMDQNTKRLLQDIGVSEQYIEKLEEIEYLFPKAQGVMSVKYTLILLWIKAHYPKEFKEILGCRKGN